jgi:FAD/FMN-containing dehydrogenase
MNRLLSQHGLTFGPDPASAERATIGGIVGNNSTGAHSSSTVMTSDHVLAVDAVL